MRNVANYRISRGKEKAIHPSSKKYHLEVSTSIHDEEWDEFILDTPNGHYTQTALWAEVKSVQGWLPYRVLIKNSQGIVAGAQILTRQYPLIGKIGYISKGPLCGSKEQDLYEIAYDEIDRFCDQNHFAYLAIQPPDHCVELVNILTGRGLNKCLQGNLELPATLLVDLRTDEAGIKAQIEPKRRRYLPYSGKHGFTFREGTREDLCFFYELHNCLGTSKHFEVQSEGFFNQLWDVFAPKGYVHVYLVELNNTPVSAEVAITYKETYTRYRMGWSSKHGEQHPNEGLVWNTMLWAKEHGYAMYDLGGITLEAAKCVINGNQDPSVIKGTYSEFKLRFTKNVVLYPETYEKVYYRTLSWGMNALHSIPVLRNFLKNLYKLSRRR